MLQTIVQRLPGDKTGGDISDPLLTTPESQIERGRNEVDFNFSNRVRVNGNGPADEYVEPCGLANVTDSEKGQYRALIESCSLVFDIGKKSISASSSITFEREEI
jgi:hypothetical protein